MGRLKLDFPNALFETELDIRISEINYGQHLGNDAVLALAHEARLRFLASKGFSEKDAGGVGLIMLDALIVYRAQARWGDRLLVQVALGEMRACDFEMFYRFLRKADLAEIAVVKTTLAFFDYQKARIARMPALFSDRMIPPPPKPVTEIG